MKMRLLQCSVIVSALFGGQALAQLPNPQVQQCVQAFNQKHGQAMSQHAALTKAGRIDAKEEQAFRAMEGRLRANQAAAAKGGISMPECQALHAQIDGEMRALQQMAATPATPAKPGAPAVPPVQACLQAFGQKHTQVMQQHATLTKAGRIDAKEQAAFKGMEDRLRASHAAATKGGITIQECQALHAQVDGEMRTLQQMATTPAANPVPACLQAFGQKHTQVMQQHAALTKAGRIDAKEQAAFKGMEERLRASHTAASKGGISLPECQALHTQLDGEMRALQAMGQTPAAKK